MRIGAMPLAAAAVLIAGAATAQPIGQYPPRSTIICLDVSGRLRPKTCKVPASRLDPSEDICICPADTERVTVPICPPGVRPPPESAAYEQARRAAVHNGSLMGATWQGQPMCMAAREPGRGR